MVGWRAGPIGVPEMEEEMSKGQKHTPGPWIADGTTVMTSDGIYLHVATTHFLTDRPEANARLIAAAPEMLAALKALHACHRAFSGSDAWTILDDEARAAAEAKIGRAHV